MNKSRQFAEDKLVIATHNKGKLREITALFDKFEFQVLSASSLGLAEPKETEKSFRGNALLKAHAAADATKLPALADDSGLVVAALNGEPGIYSARWAAPDGDFDMAMLRVHNELNQVNANDMSANFVCALALVWPDGYEVCVEGRVAGQVTWPPRGKFGFGYDAIFQPTGYSQSFGEMDPADKHRINHRADAFAQLIAKVFAT